MSANTTQVHALFASAAFALSTFGAAVAGGQILHASGERPSFEVATIRPWESSLRPLQPPPDGAAPPRKVMKLSPVGVGGQATDRVHMILPVALLIASAYNIPVGSEGRRILGPAWLERQSEQYEITAKIDDAKFARMQTMTPAQQHEQVELMEQSLLEDRFKLKVHFESREMPVYALVVAPRGPKLTAASPGETSKLATLSSVQGSELTATAVTIEEFALSPLLTGPAGVRQVVDQTGLHGAYDFSLKWSPQQGGPPEGPPLGTDEPSFFTAIREQLGLRLVPSKAQVEVVIVDHIELPSAN